MSENKYKELTKEQEALIPEYVARFKEIGLSIEPADRLKAEAAFKKLYELQKLELEFIEWFDSPFEGQKRAAQHVKGDENVTDDEIRAMASSAAYGSFDSYWVAFYAMLSEQKIDPIDPVYDVLVELSKNCGVYWTLEGVVIATDKPTEIHIKDNTLHNPNGMALKYKNGDGVYVVDGRGYKTLMEATLSQVYEDDEQY
jgi:hypothetical protein